MNRGFKKFWPLFLISATLVLAACSERLQEEDPDFSNNLTVVITSPVENRLYNQQDFSAEDEASPSLTYAVTEGRDDDTVPVDRLSASIGDLDEDGNVTGTTEITDMESGAPLPTLQDGEHELKFVVKDGLGAPELTVVVRFSQDITVPDVTICFDPDPVTGLCPADITSENFFTNDSTPAIFYTIDHPCYNADPQLDTCDDPISAFKFTMLVYDEVLGTSKRVDAKNGESMAPQSQGDHRLELNFVDESGNILRESIIFTVDGTEPIITTVDVPPSDPTVPGNDSIGDGKTITTDSGDLNLIANEPVTVDIYLDASQECQDFLMGIGESTEVDCSGWLTDQEVALDGGVIPGTFTFDALTVDGHIIVVVAEDQAANTAAFKYAFVKTESGPKVEIFKPASGALFNVDIVSLDYIVSDAETKLADLTVKVELHQGLGLGLSAENYSAAALVQTLDPATPSTFTVPADGQYTVYIEATDLAGFATGIAREFTVDTTDPVATITKPADGSTVSGVPVLEFFSSESGASAVVYLFAGAYDPAQLIDVNERTLVSGSQLRQVNGDPLIDGQYTVAVILTDLAGNVSEPAPDPENPADQGYSTFNLNAIGPIVTILDPADGAVVRNGNVTVHFRVSQSTSYQVLIRNQEQPASADQPVVGGSCAKTTNPSDTNKESCQVGSEFLGVDGFYVITVRAFDPDFGQTDAMITIQAISDVPNVGIVYPDADDHTFRPDEPITLQLSFSNDVVSVEVTVINTNNSGPVFGPATFAVPLAAPVSFGPITTEGVYEIQVIASNTLRTNSAAMQFTIDGLAPGITILAPTEGQFTSSPTITLLYSIVEGNGIDSETVWLDDFVVPLAKSGDIITLSTFGPHTIKVQAVDLAGNPSTVAAVNFVFDGTKPVVTITIPEIDEEIVGSTLVVAYSIVEGSDISKETVWLDDIEQEGIISGGEIFNISLGEHVLKVQVEDVAGNKSDIVSAPFTMISADPPGEAPTVTIHEPASGSRRRHGNVKVSYSIHADNGVGAENVSLNGVDLGDVSKFHFMEEDGHTNEDVDHQHEFYLKDLVAGSYTLEIQVIDMDGTASNVAFTVFEITRRKHGDDSSTDCTLEKLHQKKDGDIHFHFECSGDN